jgi:hypothetical protein
MNYLNYYHLEQYLFNKVGPEFSRTRKITASDYFCIVIWKANRAKSKEAKRLLSKGYKTLQGAVTALANDINKAKTNKELMSCLIETWGFRLPMASAILTVLYPNDFTVYDVRVCDEIGGYHSIHGRKFEGLWSGYEEFVKSVKKSTPKKLALRDKDRWLWGRSFCNQLSSDIKQMFGIKGITKKSSGRKKARH